MMLLSLKTRQRPPCHGKGEPVMDQEQIQTQRCQFTTLTTLEGVEEPATLVHNPK